MKRFAGLIVFMVVVSLAGPAVAETVWAQYKGVQYNQTVHVYRDGAYYKHVYASPMNLNLDGSMETAFCVDLEHTMGGGLYQAEIIPAPRTANWCQMAFITENYQVYNKFTAAVLQVAVWKLTYPEIDITVSEASIEAAANDLLAESFGTCPLTCGGDVDFAVELWADMYGTIHVLATLLENGEPVAGETVVLDTDSGFFLSPANGVGETDANGQLHATIDLDGGSLPLTVTADADGQWFNIIKPTNKYQTLQTLTYGEPCYYDASGDFDATPLGDPRTIGFWKHQAKTALGGKGKNHVSAATLESWLPIEVFDLVVDSLDGLYDALWVKKASMQQRANQQCLATMLNIAYGQLAWYTDIDLDDDGASDGWFWQLYGQALDAYYAGDFETAKTICDDINNL